MKLLNIDDLAKPKRAIVVGGYEHQLAEQSVGQLIEAAKLDSGEVTQADDVVAKFESYVKTIRRLIPTCPEEVVRGLTVKQMSAIVKFSNDPDEDIVQAAADEKKDQVIAA